MVKGGAKCRNELVMFGKERAPSGKVVKTFLHVVVQGCLVGRRLRLLEGCCCIRTWGGLCIRDVVGLYRNEGALWWGFGNVF